jgi:hypothetical protein
MILLGRLERLEGSKEGTDQPHCIDPIHRAWPVSCQFHHTLSKLLHPETPSATTLYHFYLDIPTSLV